MKSVSRPLPGRYRGPRELEATVIACAVGGAGLAGAVSPAVEVALGVATVGGPVAAAVVWAARRELRIRRRLLDLDAAGPDAVSATSDPRELSAAISGARS